MTPTELPIWVSFKVCMAGSGMTGGVQDGRYNIRYILHPPSPALQAARRVVIARFLSRSLHRPRLDGRRLRLRVADRADRSGAGRQAQRLVCSMPGRRATRPRQWTRIFRELPSLLEPGDLLVFNDTG
ncbi:MAG: hypothetical protein IPG93_16045 [Burkholderiales bacterium]|nr:hypothetical protein [Burkholderiales bacterium]